jgi:hypothetical protein
LTHPIWQNRRTQKTIKKEIASDLNSAAAFNGCPETWNGQSENELFPVLSKDSILSNIRKVEELIESIATSNKVHLSTSSKSQI